MELNLARDEKFSKKVTVILATKGRQEKTCPGCWIEQVDEGHGKDQRLEAIFASVFTGKIRFQESRVPENREVCSREDFPSLKEDEIIEHLNKVDT